METGNFESEHNRMLRYSISRLSLMGPKSFLEAQERVKERTMKECHLDEKSYNEMFKDLQEQNGWGEVEATAYFETSMMFE